MSSKKTIRGLREKPVLQAKKYFSCPKQIGLSWAKRISGCRRQQQAMLKPKLNAVGPFREKRWIFFWTVYEVAGRSLWTGNFLLRHRPLVSAPGFPPAWWAGRWMQCRKGLTSVPQHRGRELRVAFWSAEHHFSHGKMEKIKEEGILLKMTWVRQFSREIWDPKNFENCYVCRRDEKMKIYSLTARNSATGQSRSP